MTDAVVTLGAVLVLCLISRRIAECQAEKQVREENRILREKAESLLRK